MLRDSQQSIDLIINDLVMPHMNALELYDAMQELQGSVQMLIIASYPMPETGITLVERPGVRWLSMPVSVEQFEEASGEMALG